jgi:hypothetical protein
LHGGEGNLHFALGLILLFLLLCGNLACHLVLFATLCVSIVVVLVVKAHCRIQSSIALACGIVNGYFQKRIVLWLSYR